MLEKSSLTTGREQVRCSKSGIKVETWEQGTVQLDREVCPSLSRNGYKEERSRSGGERSRWEGQNQDVQQVGCNRRQCWVVS